MLPKLPREEGSKAWEEAEAYMASPRRPVLRTLMATVLPLHPQCGEMGRDLEQTGSCRGKGLG